MRFLSDLGSAIISRSTMTIAGGCGSGGGGGGSGCGIRFQGTLVANSDSVQADANHYGPTIGPRTLAAVLSLPAHFVAGVPIEAQFFLDFGTGPGGGAHAEAICSYRVVGLPAGVHAIACSGADVIPVLRSTWGRLKSAYR